MAKQAHTKIGVVGGDERRSFESMEHVKVVARLRPPEPQEAVAGETSCLRMTGNLNSLELCEPSSSKKKVFQVDRVLGPSCDQREVYEDWARPLVISATRGYNSTIFAYGHTGSGKSYTMMGSAQEPGITPRAVRDVFREIDRAAKAHDDAVFLVHVSYVELYNNAFRNLLDGFGDARDKKKIEIRESKTAGVFLSGPSNLRLAVRSEAEVRALVSFGDRARATSATLCNDHSSRSHAVLTLHIQSRDTMGKLNLVDLAGSERVSMSGARGETLVEAQNINLSLALLGDVLAALSRRARQQQHPDCDAAGSPPVPYRNSKLTHLLKDSLGGNSRTLMIANLRSHAKYYRQSLVTLMYATRAREIKNRTEIVVATSADDMGSSLKAVTTEIQSLHSRLVAREQQFEALCQARVSTDEENKALRAKLAELEAANRTERSMLEARLGSVVYDHRGKLAKQQEEFSRLQARLKARLEEYQETCSKQQREIEDLRVRVSEGASKTQVADMQRVLAAWQLQAVALQKELKQQRDKFDGTFAAQAQAKAHLDAELKDALEARHRADAAAAEARRHSDHDRKRIANLQDELRIVQAQKQHADTEAARHRETALAAAAKPAPDDAAARLASALQLMEELAERHEAEIQGRKRDRLDAAKARDDAAAAALAAGIAVGSKRGALNQACRAVSGWLVLLRTRRVAQFYMRWRAEAQRRRMASDSLEALRRQRDVFEKTRMQLESNVDDVRHEVAAAVAVTDAKTRRRVREEYDASLAAWTAKIRQEEASTRTALEATLRAQESELENQRHACNSEVAKAVKHRETVLAVEHDERIRDLDNQRRQLATLLAERDEVEGRRLEEERRNITLQHQAQLAEIAESHKAALEEERARGVKVLLEHKARSTEDWSQQRRALISQHNDALEASVVKCEALVEEARRREASNLKDHERRSRELLENQRAQLVADNRVTLADAKAQYDVALNKAGRLHAAALAQCESRISTELQRQRDHLLTEHTMILEKATAEHVAALDEVRCQAEATSADHASALARELERQRQTLSADHEAAISTTIAQERQEARAREAALTAKHEDEMARELQRQREHLMSSHEESLAATLAKFQAFLDEARQREADIIAEQQTKLADQLDHQRCALVSEHQSALSKLKAQYEAALDDVRNQEALHLVEFEEKLEHQRALRESEHSRDLACAEEKVREVALEAARDREDALAKEHAVRLAQELERQREALVTKYEIALKDADTKYQTSYQDALANEASLKADIEKRVKVALDRQHESITSAHNASLAELTAQCETLRNEARARESELTAEYETRLSHELEHQKRELSSARDSAIANIEKFYSSSIEASRAREAILAAESEARLISCLETQRHALDLQHETAHGETITKYEALLEEARVREIALTAEHRDQIARDLDEQRRALVSVHQLALTGLRAKHEAMLEEVHDREIELKRRHDQQLERQREELVAAHANEIAAAREREACLAKERDAQLAREVETLRQALASEHEAALAGTIAKYETALEEARAHEVALTAQHRDHLEHDLEGQRQALVSAHQAAVTELKAKYEARMKEAEDREIKLAKQHEQQLEHQRAGLEAECDSAILAAQQREACLLQEHSAHVASELESLRRARTLEHEAAITEIVARHEAECDEARTREVTLKADHDARLARDLDEQRQTLVSENHRALAESKAKYDAMLNEARNHESELMREHELQLEHQRMELVAHHNNAISAAREREKSLTEKFHAQLAADLGIQRQALVSEHSVAQAKKIALYDGLLEEARRREVTLVTEHGVQLSRKLNEQHQALLAAHEVALADVKSKYEAQLDEKHNHHVALTRDYEEQLERQREEFDTERNNAKLVALERELSLDKERNAQLAHELDTQRQALLSEHQAELSGLIAKHNASLEETRAREAASTAEHNDRLAQELGEQRQALLAAHRVELNDIKAKYETQLAKAHDREIVLMKEHNSQLKRQHGDFVVEYDEAMSAARERQALMEKKRDAQLAHELEIQRNALTSEFETAHANTVAKYEALVEQASASKDKVTAKQSNKQLPRVEQVNGVPCHISQTKVEVTQEALFDDAQDRVADCMRVHEQQTYSDRNEFAFERHRAVENEAMAFAPSLNLANSAVTIRSFGALDSEDHSVLSGHQIVLIENVANDKVTIDDAQSREATNQGTARGHARDQQRDALVGKHRADVGYGTVENKAFLNGVHPEHDRFLNQELKQKREHVGVVHSADIPITADQKQVTVLSTQEAAKMRQSATCQDFDARLSRELERQRLALKSQHQVALTEAAAKHEAECRERWEGEVQARVAKECRRMGSAYEAALKQAREEVLTEQKHLRRSEREKLEAAHREALASVVSSCEVTLATKREAVERCERASREALRRREDELVESHERRLITAVRECRREHELESALRRRDAALCAALRWLVERVWSMYMHDLEKYRRNWEITLFGGKRMLVNAGLVAQIGVKPPTNGALSPVCGSPTQRRRIDDMVAGALQARDQVTLDVVARMLRRRDENSAAALEAALRRANSRHVRRVSMLIKLRDTYWQELLKAALRESDTKHSLWRSEAVRTSLACERRPLEEVGNKKQDMSDEIRELKLQLERERQARWDLLSGAMKEPIAPAAHVDIGSRIVAAAVQGDATGLRAIFDDAGLASLESPAARTLRCSTHSILPVHRALAGWSFHGDRVKLLTTLDILIAAGADLSAPDSNGDTALHRALVGLPGLETITFLIDRGARVDATNALGNTPLHVVARKLESDAPDKARALLERGANSSALNSQGHTPLDVASHAAKTDAQRQLLTSLSPLLRPTSNQ